MRKYQNGNFKVVNTPQKLKIAFLDMSSDHSFCLFILVPSPPLALHVTLNKWCFAVFNPRI